jgi:uncharacterized protein with HEPN domain
MPLEVWSYVPQRVFEATATSAVRVIASSPRAEIVGAPTTRILREFRLQYTAVPSAEIRSMAAFYLARQGPFEAFLFQAVTDSRTYLVRFTDELQIEHFSPSLFRTQAIALTEVTS